MNKVVLLMVGLCFFPVATGCLNIDKKSPHVDYMDIHQDFAAVAPADIAVVPVEAVRSMDRSDREKIRTDLYDLLMAKGYAPVALEYIDQLLADKGLLKQDAATIRKWKTDTYRDLFFSDALLMVSIESFSEPGLPDNEGIEIWGKIGLFDSKTMEVLYEHYIRRNLILSDPGSREKYVAQALRDFSRELLAYLPDKPTRKFDNTEGGTIQRAE